MTHRRRPALHAPRALVVCALVAGGCSALDNFTDFRFGDGGSDGSGAAADALPSAVGAACGSAGCGGGLTCVGASGDTSFPGGMCSRPCDPSSVAGCPAGSQCVSFGNGGLCLASCDTLVGPACRAGWACCRDRGLATGPGACAPPSSGVCNH